MWRAWIVLLGLSWAGVSHADGGAHSMKGWELRSWVDADDSCGAQARSGITRQWCFSLVVGTNREKTIGEVVAPRMSLAALLRKLRELDKGEEIGWQTDGGVFPLPPAAIRNSIEHEARRLGLKLAPGR